MTARRDFIRNTARIAAAIDKALTAKQKNTVSSADCRYSGSARRSAKLSSQTKVTPSPNASCRVRLDQIASPAGQ